MRIDITHFGEDYAKIEIQRHNQKTVVEYEVSQEIAKQTRSILRSLERVITSQASQALKVKN